MSQWPASVRPSRTLKERHFMALIRSKAQWAERRQYLADATFYGAEPPTAEAVARRLITDAQNHFRCNKELLIVDRVI